jgi:hypothetical protein
MPLAIQGLGCDCGHGYGLGDVQNPYAPGGMLYVPGTDPTKIYDPSAPVPPAAAGGLITPIPSIPANAPTGTYYDPTSGNYMVPYQGPLLSNVPPGPGAQPNPAGLNMFGAPIGYLPIAPGLLAASLGTEPSNPVGPVTFAMTASGTKGGAPLVQTSGGNKIKVPGTTPEGNRITSSQQQQQQQLQQQQMINGGGGGNTRVSSPGGAGGGAPVSTIPSGSPGVFSTVGNDISSFFSNLTPTEMIIGVAVLGIIGLYMFSGGSSGTGAKFRMYGG